MAIGIPHDKILGEVVALFRGLLDYTVPVVSLIKGERISRNINAFTAGADVRDMWLPYFCVSTNLTRSRVEVHDRGDAATAIRASVAIPGILPPVPHDGELLVDGGVLNNLPCDVMRASGAVRRLIAVDLSPPSGPRAREDFGHAVSGWKALRAQLGPGQSNFPGLMSILMRALVAGSVRDRDRFIDDGTVDWYLDLDLRGVALLDFERVEVAAARGYEAARPRIEALPRRGRRLSMWLLTLRDLQYRRLRMLVVTLLASVVMALLFLMTGLVNQFNREPYEATAAIGAEQWVLAAGTSGPFTSGGTLPTELVGELGDDARGVVVARGTISDASDDAAGDEVVVVGGELDDLQTTMAVDAIVEGRPIEGPGEVLIDRTAGFDVGDELRLGPQPVVGGRPDVRHDGAGRPAARVRRAADGAGPLLQEPGRGVRRAPRRTPGGGARGHRRAVRRRRRRRCPRPVEGRHRLGRPGARPAVAGDGRDHRRRRVPVGAGASSATSPSSGRWASPSVRCCSPLPCRPCSSPSSRR